MTTDRIRDALRRLSAVGLSVVACACLVVFAGHKSEHPLLLGWSGRYLMRWPRNRRRAASRSLPRSWLDLGEQGARRGVAGRQREEPRQNLGGRPRPPERQQRLGADEGEIALSGIRSPRRVDQHERLHRCPRKRSLRPSPPPTRHRAAERPQEVLVVILRVPRHRCRGPERKRHRRALRHRGKGTPDGVGRPWPEADVVHEVDGRDHGQCIVSDLANPHS